MEVDLVAAKADRFADAEPVAVHHENEQVVTHAVPPSSCGFQERLDLARRQKVLGPLVRIGRRLGAAFYITPVGRGGGRHRKSLAAHGRPKQLLTERTFCKESIGPSPKAGGSAAPRMRTS